MQKLIEGVHRFRQGEFCRYKGIFRRLSRYGQKPHTLFITCADSRVLAELITQSNPGDLFVVKNVGNFIPSYAPDEGYNSTAAAIEFAVCYLDVTDVVVCGHSQCGAITALMAPTPTGLPHLDKWISLARPVRDLIETKYSSLDEPAARIRAAEEENVLFALEQLHTYPCVAERLQEQKLRLHGWFFKIATAELFAYDSELKQFVEITPEEEAPAA